MFLILLLSSITFAGPQLHLRTGSIDLAKHSSADLSSLERHGEWMVQFPSPIEANDRKKIQAVGAKILAYVPDHALLVRGVGASLKNVLGARIYTVAPVQPRWKISEDLLQAMDRAENSTDRSTGTTAAVKRSRVQILTFDASEAGKVSQTIRSSLDTARILEVDGRVIAAEVDLKSVRAISQIQGVENIEFAPKIELLAFKTGVPTALSGDYKDLTGKESGTEVMKFQAAWDAGLTGQGEVAAAADTGLDVGVIGQLSADFQGAVVGGSQVGIGAKDWADPMGHGTHVAGSIAGRGTASNGLLRGGAFAAEFFPVGMWSPLLTNLTVPPRLEKIFDPAFAKGARVHSNSWGAPANLGAYDGMAVQVDEYATKNPELLIVFAAGNSGVDKDSNGVIDSGSVSSPGTAKNALTVGASENFVEVGGIQRKISELRNAQLNWPAEPIASSKLSDNINGIACFSSRGPTKDGRLKPEIVAPGTNVLSTRSHAPGAEVLWGAYNSEYVYSGGTSMATPLAAGAAVLIREHLRKNLKISDPSAALVKAMLFASAEDLFPGQYGTGVAQELQRRPENNQGYGRVNMERMMKGSVLLTQDEQSGLSLGQRQQYSLQLMAGQQIAISLVYMDPAGTPMAGKALVNDLNLQLMGPGGTMESKSAINNHEWLEFSAQVAGNYTVTVSADNLPKGGQQSFALVVYAH